MGGGATRKGKTPEDPTNGRPRCREGSAGSDGGPAGGGLGVLTGGEGSCGGPGRGTEGGCWRREGTVTFSKKKLGD